MNPVAALLALSGAVIVGVILWISVVQFVELADVAWWAPLLALVFPVVAGVAVWRNWGN